MTTTIFKHIDPASYQGKPWTKVDGPGMSFKMNNHERKVYNIRGNESDLNDTDKTGFAVYNEPAKEKLFTDDKAVREGYYAEVEDLVKRRLGARKVHIFDHTIRRRTKDSPRQPVQQVHVDQTPEATAVRVRRHLPAEEAEELLKGRYQIVNVWRPIENPASDFPLAVIDWRSTQPSDFIPVDLMYPKRPDSAMDDDDDRGKEKVADPSSYYKTEGYEVRGETLGVAPNEGHRFYYMKDMTPDEVMLLKCYDSFGEGQPMGKRGLAVRTPHTAFIDPNTPKDAPGRQSIEVRCLVFY